MAPKTQLKALDGEGEYTIGWIAAIPEETAAAKAMLDERHRPPAGFQQSNSDPNVYTFGRIAQHNVVIAQLGGGYGTTNALATGMPMLTTFSNIQLGLLVGIAAGVPSQKHDIRLGDIVISRPINTSPGVFQHDLGRARGDENSQFEVTGSFARPPVVLLKAAEAMEAEHKVDGTKIPALIEEAIKKHPKLKTSYTYPGAEHDLLFANDYRHMRGGPCTQCDPSRALPRPPRADDEPEVHYGVIASGNSVVKDARLRDSIARMQSNCICIEMEAAGLMNHFPCLVIRGICDYGDSHKNDMWHPYAAATAAACAKELLEYVPRREVAKQKPIQVEELTKQILAQQNKLHSDENVAGFLKALTGAGGRYTEHKNRVIKRADGTCEWFTNHPLFHEWLEDSAAPILWVTADPGCGKSVLSKYLIDQVLVDSSAALPQSERPTICYFFFKDDFPEQKYATHAICAILLQLFHRRPQLFSAAVLKEFSSYGQDYVMSFQPLWRTFLSVISASDGGPVICVLDALDECQEASRRELIHAITRFTKDETLQSKLKFFVTSRPYSQIVADFNEMEAQFPRMRLRGEAKEEVEQISKEINLVIQADVERITEEAQLNVEDSRKLLRHLTQNPHRTYLWVYLAINELKQSHQWASGNIDRILQDVGSSVDHVYEKMLNKSPKHDLARQFLKIVVAAYRPQTVSEIFVAVRVFEETRSQSNAFENLPSQDRLWAMIRDTCGLFVTMIDSKIYLIHQTAKEFLVPNLVIEEQGASRNGSIALPVESLSPTKLWKHTFRLDECHTLMAQICTRFLLLPEGNIGVNKFTQYCSVNLYAHLYESNLDVQSDVIRQALWFLDETLFGWWDAIVEHMPWFQGSNSKYLPSGKDSLLARAAYLGIPAMVECLLQSPMVADINHLTGKKWSPLHLAALNGHTEVMRLLIRYKAKLNIRGANSQTPLWAAIEGGSLPATKLLLSHKVKVNRIAEEAKDVECAPILCATKVGSYDMVKLLLDHKADANNWFIWGGMASPLKDAILLRRHDLVELLLRHGAFATKPLLLSTARTTNNNSNGKPMGRLIAPLLLAIKQQSLEIIKLLISAGASVKDRTNDGIAETTEDGPLAYAVHHGTLEICELLIDHGADVNAGDNNFRQRDNFVSPLIRGIKHFKIEAVKMLLSRKAKFDAQAVEAEPKRGALRTLADIKLADDLIPAGSGLGLADSVAIRLFLLTANIPYSRSIDSMNLSKDILQSLTETPGSDLSLLNRAISTGHLYLARTLILGGRDIAQLEDDEKGMLLVVAAKAGDAELVKLALNYAAYKETKEPFTKRTALSLAASNGEDGISERRKALYPIKPDYETVARLLLSRNADVETQDANGKTPTAWAETVDNPWWPEVRADADSGPGARSTTRRRESTLNSSPGRNGSVFPQDAYPFSGAPSFAPSSPISSSPPLRQGTWQTISTENNRYSTFGELSRRQTMASLDVDQKAGMSKLIDKFKIKFK